MKLTAKDIEYAIAKYINWRRHLIVPNVSWGLGFEHELDLAVVSKAGYLKEIELLLRYVNSDLCDKITILENKLRKYCNVEKR